VDKNKPYSGRKMKKNTYGEGLKGAPLMGRERKKHTESFFLFLLTQQKNCST